MTAAGWSQMIRRRCPGCRNEVTAHIAAGRVSAVGAYARGTTFDIGDDDDVMRWACPVCGVLNEIHPVL